MSHRRRRAPGHRRDCECDRVRLTRDELEALEELEQLGIGFGDGFQVVRDLDAYDPDVDPYYNHLED